MNELAVLEKESFIDDDLGFSGRKANKNVASFHLLGKSKHQQYFASLDLSETIFKGLLPAIDENKIEKVRVLDPTCGSGRLLVPWNKAGAKVIGIELDKQAGTVARRLISKQNVRIGDLLDYKSLIQNSFDIVVTNPPFSLFRDYVAQLVKYDKKFLIIGNINAITYKEIFKLIKENKTWLGINLGRGISGFIVPEHYELYGTEARIDSLGNRIVSPNNCLWLTNLDTSIRHEDIALTKRYFGNEAEYPKYDNYDGINVNKTQDIPLDFKGVIGVPITFLHKFNPDQFEIIKFRKGNDEKAMLYFAEFSKSVLSNALASKPPLTERQQYHTFIDPTSYYDTDND